MAEFQALSRKHDRAAFDCGSEPLNSFLKTTARQHQDRGISRTFVLIDPMSAAPLRILGYFTLSACEGEAGLAVIGNSKGRDSVGCCWSKRYAASPR